ncbi:MAG TPA: DUF4334 domain-containing protein, partial [Lentzea sp.]
RERFRQLRGVKNVSPAELDEIWAALATVRAEEILGEWKGDEFHTGHRANGRLESTGWYGKTFNSVDDAKPLICRGPDGNLYSNVEIAKGEATLWNEEFRGEVTATMVYDGCAIHDHFKRVDDDTLMGVMNGKHAPMGESGHFYFLLERV